MFPVLTARSFFRDFFMVNLRFNPVFFLLKYCKTMVPRFCFIKKLNEVQKKRAVIIVHNIIS